MVNYVGGIGARVTAAFSFVGLERNVKDWGNKTFLQESLHKHIPNRRFGLYCYFLIFTSQYTLCADISYQYIKHFFMYVQKSTLHFYCYWIFATLTTKTQMGFIVNRVFIHLWQKVI